MVESCLLQCETCAAVWSAVLRSRGMKGQELVIVPDATLHFGDDECRLAYPDHPSIRTALTHFRRNHEAGGRSHCGRIRVTASSVFARRRKITHIRWEQSREAPSKKMVAFLSE